MPERRIGIITLATAFLFLVVVAGLVRLQVCDSALHEAQAERQRQSTHTVRPLRGTVYDRNGLVLAQDETGYDIDIRPALAEESEAGLDAILQQVASIASLDLEHIRNRFAKIEAKVQTLFEREMARIRRQGDLAAPGSRKRERQEKVARHAYRSLAYPLVRNVVPSVRDRAHEAALPGILITPRPLRNYPQGTLAAHLLGHLSELSSDDEYRRRGIEQAYRKRLVPRLGERRVGDLLRRNTFRIEPYGVAGIEKQYDHILRGGYGVIMRQATPTGKEPLFEVPPLKGTDLHLTLDARLQKLAETLLDGRPGAVVAMDPRNGEILVLASSPTFDPMNPTEAERAEDFPLVNRAIAGLYPPGSTIKAADAVAALEEIPGFASQPFTCAGSYFLGGREMRCMHTHGPLQLLQAIKKSCNIFFYQTGLALGTRPTSKLYQWLRRFQVGDPTGIDLPGEKGGILTEPRFGGDVANLAIGQGNFAITPLRMAVLFSAIANGKMLVTPHLRQGADVRHRKIQIRPETLRTVRRGLWMVVNERGGTANRAFRGAGYEAAGKTGSAQHGGEGTTHAWFVGYAPAANPTLCIAVILERAGGGGSKAAPIARALFDKFLLQP